MRQVLALLLMVMTGLMCTQFTFAQEMKSETPATGAEREAKEKAERKAEQRKAKEEAERKAKQGIAKEKAEREAIKQAEGKAQEARPGGCPEGPPCPKNDVKKDDKSKK